MEALQAQLRAAEEERDAARNAATQASADRAHAIQELAAATAAAPAQPAPTLVALSPALATTAAINYLTGERMKMYGKATAPMDLLFSVDAALLRLF
jgi:hypothetical protein